jgi:hypothetical protein
MWEASWYGGRGAGARDAGAPGPDVRAVDAGARGGVREALVQPAKRLPGKSRQEPGDQGAQPLPSADRARHALRRVTGNDREPTRAPGPAPAHPPQQREVVAVAAGAPVPPPGDSVAGHRTADGRTGPNSLVLPGLPSSLVQISTSVEPPVADEWVGYQ